MALIAHAIFLFLVLFANPGCGVDVNVASSSHYTNTWVIQVVGGPHLANAFALKHGFSYKGKIFNDFYLFEHKKVVKRSTSQSDCSEAVSLGNEIQVKWLMQQKKRKRELYAYPSYGQPVKGSSLNRRIELDMNIESAWQNYTGENVNVSVVDDGLQYDHPDLLANYNKDNSFDVVLNDSDPYPKSWRDGHGTRSAGVIAAVYKKNPTCTRGVAHNARISGVRLFGNRRTTDEQKARALQYNHETTDIYSCSWGPPDTGWDTDGPGHRTKAAILKGATTGRAGLGSIYVFAAGNGGVNHDTCAYNGFANNIYTITINGANQDGSVPAYAEQCTAILATAYSNDKTKGEVFKTTDTGNIWNSNRCSTAFGGTSAAASVASGVVALALQAAQENRSNKLTWRDLQHLIVRTSRSYPLCSKDWKTNGAGLNVSSFFGFGLLDAKALARMASHWISVPQQKRCQRSANLTIDTRIIPTTEARTIGINVSETTGNCTDVNFLEHVQVRVTLAFTRRGHLEIDLVSPSNTKAKILPSRRNDVLDSNLIDWELLSVQFWGEDPKGMWYIKLTNVHPNVEGNKGNIDEISLILYGTQRNPVSKENKRNLQDILPSRQKPTPRCAKYTHKFGQSSGLECLGNQIPNYIFFDNYRMDKPYLESYYRWPSNCEGCKTLCTRNPSCLSVSCLPAKSWNNWRGTCQFSKQTKKTAPTLWRRFWKYYEKSCTASTTIPPPTTQRKPVSTSTVKTEYTCSSKEWFIFNHSCYKEDNSMTDRSSAKQKCENYGGYLVAITSQEENQFLTRMTSSSSQHWIGLWRNSKGNFYWDTGKKQEHFGFNKWSPGEPNNAGNRESCAEINTDNGKWNDVSCYERHSFICETDAVQKNS